MDSTPEPDASSRRPGPVETARSTLVLEGDGETRAIDETRQIDEPYWIDPLGGDHSPDDALAAGARRTRQGIIASAGFALTILAVVVLAPDSERLETTSTLDSSSTTAENATESAADRLRSRPAETVTTRSAGERTSGFGTGSTGGSTTTAPASTVGPTTGRETTAAPTTGSPATTGRSTTSRAPTSTTGRQSSQPPSTAASPTSLSTTASTTSTTSPVTSAPSDTTAGTSTSTTAPTSTSSTSSTAPTSTAPPQCALDDAVAVSDTFAGSSLDLARWAVTSGQAGTVDLRPSAVTVANGALVITASMDGTTTVSGAVALVQAQTYGRYEVRARMTGDGSAEATLRVGPPSAGFGSDGPLGLALIGGGWQTLVIDWSPDRIALLRNGTVISTVAETGQDEVPDDARVLAVELDPSPGPVSTPVSVEVGIVEIRAYHCP